MQPLALAMEAFGPFARRQRVEFAALREHGLYLISGPTGSGKSTLLDGITFALYGESSGKERSAEELRSDHAAPETETRVSFDFLLGDAAWRVTRTPRWERPKQRGEGTTTVASTAELYRLEAEDGDWRPGACAASGLRDVNQAIETLLGFSAAQFRQVILLPQGQFRALLSASTDERERILEQLFDTSEHAALQRRLRERSSELERNSADARKRAGGILETVEADSIAALGERVALQARELKTLEAAANTAAAAEDAARKSLEAARDRNERLAKLDAGRAAVRDLEALDAAVDRSREALKMLRAADGLADLAEAETKAAARLDSAEKTQIEAQARLVATEKDAKDATGRLEDSEARAEEREQLARTARELEAAVERVSRWSTAKDDHDAAARALTAVRQKRTDLTAKIESLEIRQKALAGEIEQLRARAAGLDAATLRSSSAVRALAGHRETASFAGAVTRLEKQLGDAARARDEAAASRGRAASALEEKREGFIASQARLLAEALEPGEPCPVCGSTDHPEPAPDSNEIVRREDFEAAGAEHDRRAAVLEARTKRVSELDRQLAEQRGRVPEGFDVSRESALERAAAEAKRNLDEAENAGGTLAKASDALLQIDQELERTRRELGDLGTGLAAAADRESRARATLEEREQGLPEKLRSADAVTRALDTAREKRDAAGAAHKAAGRRAAETAQELAQAREAVAGAERGRQEARENHAVEAETLTGRIAEAGFESIAVLRSCLDRRHEIEALAEEVSAHDDALKAARAVVVSLEHEAGKEARSELEPLERSLNEASTVRTGAAAALVRARKAQEDDQRALERLAGIDRECAELDAAYAVLATLSSVANDRAMTFQRHVLAVLLDRVLLLASVHLQRMSRGRYQLFRSSETRDARVHRGLDLEVEDAYTGKCRSVGTLSGGEGFMTALALALGLSETVQNLAGGIRLDALFIDEGFGSLDEEALDLAIDTLLGLRSAGRTVGVISHVPEMRQRLDARIEVVKRQDGSAVRVVLP